MDAILILGAAVWADGPSPTLVRRARRGAALWHAGVAPCVIACGGLGRHPPTEAAAIATLLLADGVPPAAILTEDRSTTTLDNIRLALPLLRALEARRVAIVTDATHGPRAALVARHFGLQPRVFATPLRGSHPRSVLRQAVRELGAYPAYALRLRRVPRDGSPFGD